MEKKKKPQAAVFVSKYFCIVYILYIFVVTYYLSTDSIKDFFFSLSHWLYSYSHQFHQLLGKGWHWSLFHLGLG